MEYRRLGNTGLEVSRLCFGSLTFTQTRTGASYAGETLGKALRHGVNFIDTAQFYENYALLRGFLEKSPEVLVASKTYAYTAKDAYAAVEQARTALGRDVIELFLLHEQESEHTLRGHAAALEALYTLKSKGIIKAVGLSTHHVAAVKAATRQRLDVVHPIINITGFGIADGSREDMESAISVAHRAGLGVYGMKVLGGGSLFRRAAECLSYALSLDSLDSIAIGMQSPQEVSANAEFFSTGAFSDSQQAYIESRTRRLHIESWCDACSRCVTICKSGALSLSDGKLLCDASKCRLCGYCSQVCPNLCLKIV